jgi:hypothetical protein
VTPPTSSEVGPGAVRELGEHLGSLNDQPDAFTDAVRWQGTRRRANADMAFRVDPHQDTVGACGVPKLCRASDLQ